MVGVAEVEVEAFVAVTVVVAAEVFVVAVIVVAVEEDEVEAAEVVVEGQKSESSGMEPLLLSCIHASSKYFVVMQGS